MRKILPLIILSILFTSISGRSVSTFSSEQSSVENVSLDALELQNDTLDSPVLTDVDPNWEKFGDQRNFWYFDWGYWVNVQALATLLAVGNYSYVYMDNESIDILGEEAAIAGWISVLLIGPGSWTGRQVLHRHAVEPYVEHAPVRV